MPASKSADVPSEVVQAVQRVWFAGLGAMAFAQEEGTKLADSTTRLFSQLVEKGQEIESAGRSPVQGVSGSAGAAGDAWARIQQTIDAQVTVVLQRLGVPTRDEMADLNRRIDHLTASIEALRREG